MDALGLALIGLGIFSGWCGVKGIDPRTVVVNWITNPGLPATQEHPSATSDGTVKSGLGGVAGAVTAATKRAAGNAGAATVEASTPAPKLNAGAAPPSNALTPPPYVAPSNHRSEPA